MSIPKIRLGKTDLYVTRVAFGALPVQRLSSDDAVKLLRKAYDGGINYFDTANAYTDSEEKIGLALSDVRRDIVISTKSGGKDKATVTKHIEESLRRMKTDYIDIFQFHNPPVMPEPGSEDGVYEAALEAKKKGYIRHIGITNHRIALAERAAASGLFETVQFPFCYLASERDEALVKLCRQNDVGFIAMKGLSGGMLTDAAACYAFMRQYENVVPIWGIQRESELAQWLSLSEADVQMDGDMKREIENDRKTLAQNFCRSCGYCLPCSAGIDIPQAARMAMLLRRAPYKPYMTDEWHAKMHKIDDCVHCNVCLSRCPYGLDTPKLLKLMLDDYDAFYEIHKND